MQIFDAVTYQQRRQQLTKKFENDILLFLGNEESPMNYLDNTYHFRQDSTFLYYFGISLPGLAAVIDINEGTTTIYGDEMSTDAMVWMGRQATLKERAAGAGVYQTQPFAILQTALQLARQKSRVIHYLPPYRAENKIKLFTWLQADIHQLQQTASLQFIKAVAEQRSVKTFQELAELERAVNISVDMQKIAMTHTRPGMTEAQVSALIHEVALSQDCHTAYPVILTVDGHILHNHFKGNTIKAGQLVLNDCGAETAAGYCGDLTRTFPASKTFTQQQKDVYEIVLASLQTASAALKPGVPYLEVHNTACRVLTEGLKNLGLMKGNTDNAVAAGAHSLFFQCGTGHMMGLDVHDMEDLGEAYVGFDEQVQKETCLFGLKSLRLGKALQPGYVLTVEPGIYFNPFLMDSWKADNLHHEFINYDKVEAYHNFGGIRIEDNLLITPQGAEVIGTPLAKTVAEVEDLRAGAF